MATRPSSAYVIPSGDPDDAAADDSVLVDAYVAQTDGIPPLHVAIKPANVASTATAAASRHGSTGLGKPPALCTLSWSNVSYTVNRGTSKQKKVILKNVTGRCASGELTAAMGPSGSGKTTLLDILADRMSSGTIEGEIELNGETRTPTGFRKVARYVAQEDSLLGCFTVKETLLMAAQLTLPRGTSNVATRVESVIQEMGLHVCANTYVGDVFHKGISGGQKRRLSIAMELLSNPSILLLDEPTSGLDSCATLNLLKLLSRLCYQGRTVLCTIHQPSSLVYELFTNVLILAQGETVYFGPRVHLIPHFTALGYACPQYSNPSEYYIGVVNADFESHGDIAMLVTAYSTSTIAADVAGKIKSDHGIPHSTAGTKLFSQAMATTSTPWHQFRVLLHRNLVKNVRNPGIYAVRMAMYLILAVCIGTMYLHTNPRISDNDIVVLLFGVHAFFVFNSVAVVPFFIQERAVFLRERGNSALHVGSFVVANFVAGLPGIFVIALLSSVVVVTLAGLKAFGVYFLTMFLSLVVAESLMHVIGAVANDGIVGIAIGASVFGMFMQCEGFMVPRAAIPPYWVWIHYLGFNTYGFQVFVHTQFLTDPSVPIPLAVARLGLTDVNVCANLAILMGYALVLEMVFAWILFKFHTGRR